MALAYKSCTPENGLAHFCDPCPDIEKGRVRSVAFIDKSIASTIAIPYINQVWAAAIEAGTIHIIPETSGTHDGGAPKMITGFGDKKEKKIGDDHVLTFKDPNYLENIPFYEGIEAGDFVPAWRTETLTHFAGAGVKDCIVTAKAPVEDDLESVLVWTVEVKWFSPKSNGKVQSSATTPIVDLFKCFEITEDEEA